MDMTVIPPQSMPGISFPDGTLVVPMEREMAAGDGHRERLWDYMKARAASPKLTESVKGKKLTYFNTSYDETQRMAKSLAVFI